MRALIRGYIRDYYRERKSITFGRHEVHEERFFIRIPDLPVMRGLH